MRIRTKMTGLVAGVLSAAFLVCGAFSVNQYMNASVRRLAEYEAEKMEVSRWAFEQAGSREDLEEMAELARTAYLKYQFERVYQSGYALMQGEECLKNLTDYEIVNGAALGQDYEIQRVKDRYLMMTRLELDYPEGFWVMSVKDIMEAWTEARGQAARYLAVFVCMFAAAMGVMIWSMGRMLGVLERMKVQAEAISRGDFSQKTQADTRDELADLSQSINRMSDRIQQQIEDLQLLLGTMAHETKTPVTSIIGYADSLLNVRLNEEQQEMALQSISRSARRLDQLSGKLLQLIGLYENQELETECLVMGELLRQCCAQVQDQIGDEEITLCLELDKPDGFTVEGDRVLLSILLDNLLNNAVKALDGAGRIRVHCGENSVSVEDNGCGIPAEDLPHVCKAFYMADKSRSRRKQGSGLGLALVERIVQAHGAELTIESREREGTRVTVTFP